MTYSSTWRMGGLIMSWPDHSVTILVNEIVTIWLSHQHSDLLINQDVTIKNKYYAYMQILRDDRGYRHEPAYHVHKSVASDMRTMATTPGMNFLTDLRTRALITSHLDHFATTLASGTMVIWTPYEHGDLSIKLTE